MASGERSKSRAYSAAVYKIIIIVVATRQQKQKMLATRPKVLRE
jgi:hypothetical protein